MKVAKNVTNNLYRREKFPLQIKRTIDESDEAVHSVHLRHESAQVMRKRPGRLPVNSDRCLLMPLNKWAPIWVG